MIFLKHVTHPTIFLILNLRYAQILNRPTSRLVYLTQSALNLLRGVIKPINSYEIYYQILNLFIQNKSTFCKTY